MASRFLNRFGFAFWLGLLALTVSGVAQTQLSLNVVEANLTDSHGAHGHSHDHGGTAHDAAEADGGHYMPDGTYMAGPMPGMADTHAPNDAAHATDPAQSGGHTHKGHADCIMCSLVATMASLTQPPPVAVVAPEALPAPILLISEQEIVRTTPRGPYASRAPPSQQA